MTTSSSRGRTCAVIVALLSLLIVTGPGCRRSSEQSSNTRSFVGSMPTSPAPERPIEFDTSEGKAYLKAYYELPLMREWYQTLEAPPPLNDSIELSQRSAVDLRLLRNELFARNGYLFKQAELRAYFNQFPWYQPIFDVDSFRVRLNRRERAFLLKIEAEEERQRRERYVTIDDRPMVNVDHVVNLIQFDRPDTAILAAVADHNFCIVPAEHAQLFAVYDQNQYEYFPNFITADLILQLLHKYSSRLIEGAEDQVLMPSLDRMLSRLHRKAVATGKQVRDPRIAASARWAETYLAIARTLLTGDTIAVPGRYALWYRDEVRRCMAEQPNASEMLGVNPFDYSAFKPRGNYARSPESQRYFRCVSWLNHAPFALQDPVVAGAAILIAEWLHVDPACRADFDIFHRVIGLFAGSEDHGSIASITKLLSGASSVPAGASWPDRISEIRRRLPSVAQDKILPVWSSDAARAANELKHVLFFGGRYSFDAEIFSRIVRINPDGPNRPFPKALDLFAVFGNNTARSILLNEEQEAKNWPAYPESLEVLTKAFSHVASWNDDFYQRSIATLLAMLRPPPTDGPLFMRTDLWQRKTLNTALAAWAEVKHDLILYSEQPYAAEAGEGGGPPPPLHLSYVEPNVPLWEAILEQLELQRTTLKKLGAFDERLEHVSREIEDLVRSLLKISKKELSGAPVTDEEFDKLSWIGGRVEGLTLSILQTDHMPEREKHVALVADVYGFNGTFLHAAVGNVDEIYVVAEINGLPYLTRGATFSYYEFVHPGRLTDEQWTNKVRAGQTPEPPTWVQPLRVKGRSIRSKPGLSTYEFMEHN